MTDNHDQDGPGLSIPWPPAWAVHQHRRKVIQIILWQGDLCALCDDGTIHYRKLGKDDKEYEWVQVPNLPDGCAGYTGPDLIGRPVALEGGWRQDFEIQLRQVDLDDGLLLFTGINLPGFSVFVHPNESVSDKVNLALSTFWPIHATAQADLRCHGSGVPPWKVVQHTTTFEL